MKAAATQHFGLTHVSDEFGQSPCDAYLSLPSLFLSAAHAQFIKCHQSLVRSEGTCFLSCFHRLMSDRNIFPMYNPSPCLFSLPPYSHSGWTLGESMIYTEKGLRRRPRGEKEQQTATTH